MIRPRFLKTPRSLKLFQTLMLKVSMFQLDFIVSQFFIEGNGHFRAVVPETSLQGATNPEEKPVYWFSADLRGDMDEPAPHSREWDGAPARGIHSCVSREIIPARGGRKNRSLVWFRICSLKCNSFSRICALKLKETLSERLCSIYEVQRK